MYTERNFKTKKALKEAVAEGKKVFVFQPGLGPDPKPGQTVFCEGPHYPEPHRWYANCILGDDCSIIKVK